MIQAIDNFLGELLKRLPGNKTTETDREKLRAALSPPASMSWASMTPTPSWPPSSTTPCCPTPG